MKELLFSLCSTDFIGSVRQTADVICEQMQAFCQTVTTDETGSVTAVMQGKTEQKILLQAHIDQIGMVVTHVLEGGFVRAAKVGGVDIRVLPSCMVVIHGKQKVHGIFTSTPPHLAKEEENTFSGLDTILIDTGRPDAGALISPGDFITFAVEPTQLQNGFVTGKAVDNRAGCAALIGAARLLSKMGTPQKTIVFCFSSGEELGNRGAKTSVFSIDADEAVAVDVSFAVSPGAPAQHCGVCGKGAMLGISPVLSRSVTNRLRAAAKAENLPFQTEVMGGRTSTDADVIAITKSGIPCGLLSIPIRYMHTPIETVLVSDIENTAAILCAFAAGKGDAANA